MGAPPTDDDDDGDAVSTPPTSRPLALLLLLNEPAMSEAVGKEFLQDTHTLPHQLQEIQKSLENQTVKWWKFDKQKLPGRSIRY